ncbi:Transcription factor [Penicillium malachiteum]|nr:Transcription factor [Penicillium malachiteum]
MSTRNNSARNKRSTGRRKIALACETCREKKVRCDGEKPICGPCSRRSYPIDRCVYKIENARSASNDAYLKILHDRIRELEEVCTQNGVPVQAAPQNAPEGEDKTTGGTNEAQSNATELDPESKTSVAAEGLLGLGAQPALRHSPLPIPSPAAPQPILSPLNSQSTRPDPGQSNSVLHGSLQSQGHIQPSPTGACLYTCPRNSHGSVTAMGAISVADDGDRNDSPAEQYYGNSSAASFMRLARDSIPIQSYMQNLKGIDRESSTLVDQNTGLWQDVNTTNTPPGFQFSDFSLPPRPLADHLLECYWERVHCLYPFFHRPSFEKAYENLWGSSRWPKPNLPQLNIGLGGSFDSGPQSVVFHCALNAIFALGCHFSDIPAGERESAAYTFFLRAKRFVGLDLLDRCTIGVVQTLLIVALLLQSTPYPNRCWNSIGVACRVAQGLGLYEAPTQKSISPLEKEVRCRTWHGCVMMDM